MEKKYYYDICSKYNFDTNKILNFCNQENIDIKILKKNVIFYFNNDLNKSILDLTKDEIIFLLGINNYDFILTYKKLINEILNITKKEYLYFDLKGIIYFYLLEYFKSVNYDKEKIYKKLESYELDPIKTCEFVIKYNLNIIRTKECLVKQYFSHLITKNIDSTYSLLEKILKENNQDIINKLLDNSIQNYNYVKTQIHDFLVHYYKDNYINFKNNLETKFNNYHRYKMKRKKINQELETLEKTNIERKNNLNISCNTIRSFVGSNFKSKEDFCSFNKISFKKFDYHLSIVKEFNQELYNLYYEKIEKIRNQNYAILMNFIENIIFLLKNGITINDKTRPFDLLDYYKITTLDRNKVLKLIKSNEHYDEEEYRLFLNFTRKYTSSTLLKEHDIKRILTEKHEIIIQNSGIKKEITTEEKLFVINYLNFYNIPLYDTIYFIAIRRYINNELNLDDNFKKKHLTIAI